MGADVLRVNGTNRAALGTLLARYGLKLRFIMREWTILFRKLAEAPDPAVEATLEASIRVGRNLAYLYWIGIASVCLIGAAKSF